MDNLVFIEHRSNVLNLMHLRSVSVPVPGVSNLGSSPGWGQAGCCVLGQDTYIPQCLSPPKSINGYQQIVGET